MWKRGDKVWANVHGIWLLVNVDSVSERTSMVWAYDRDEGMDFLIQVQNTNINPNRKSNS